MSTVTCPECEAQIELTAGTEVGEIIVACGCTGLLAPLANLLVAPLRVQNRRELQRRGRVERAIADRFERSDSLAKDALSRSIVACEPFEWASPIAIPPPVWIIPASRYAWRAPRMSSRPRPNSPFIAYRRPRTPRSHACASRPCSPAPSDWIPRIASSTGCGTNTQAAVSLLRTA